MQKKEQYYPIDFITKNAEIHTGIELFSVINRLIIVKDVFIFNNRQ